MAKNAKEVKYTDLSDSLIKQYKPHNLTEYFSLRWKLAGREDYKNASERHIVVQAVLDGSIELDIDNKPYLINQNQGYVFNLKKDHNIKINNYDDFKVRTVTYSPASIYFFLRNLSPSDTTILCPEIKIPSEIDQEYIEKDFLKDMVIADSKCLDLIHRVMEPLKEKGPGSQMESFHYSQLLLLHILRLKNSNLLRQYNEFNLNNSLKKEIKERLLIAIEYINDNYDKDISLNQICKNACISKFYFIRLFKELTSMTPMEYVSNIKLNHSKSLLLTTKLSVSEIAISVGFPDIYSFSRFFVKKTGISPLDFRKSNY